MLSNKRRKGKIQYEKQRRLNLSSQISKLISIVPKNFLPVGYNQIDVLVAVEKYVVKLLEGNSCSTTSIKADFSQKQFGQNIGSISSHIEKSVQTDGNYDYSSHDLSKCVIMMQPTVLINSGCHSGSKKRKICSRPAVVEHILPKSSTGSHCAVSDIPNESSIKFCDKKTATGCDLIKVVDRGCQTVQIIQSVAEVQTQGEPFESFLKDNCVISSQQQMSENTFGRVEDLIACAGSLPNNAHSVNRIPQSSNANAPWSQCLPRLPPSACSQHMTEQMNREASHCAVSSISQQNGFSVDNVLRSTPFSFSSTVVEEERNKGAYFGNNYATSSGEQLQQERGSRRGQSRSKDAKIQDCGRSRKSLNSFKSPQKPVQRTSVTGNELRDQSVVTSNNNNNNNYFAPSFDYGTERIDLAEEDIFDFNTNNSVDANWWSSHRSSQPFSWSSTAPVQSSAAASYSYSNGTSNANFNWWAMPASHQQNNQVQSELSSHQQADILTQSDRHTTDQQTNREKSHVPFHIANMLPEINPLPMHQQQSRPAQPVMERDQRLNRCHQVQQHQQEQYWPNMNNSCSINRSPTDTAPQTSNRDHISNDVPFMPSFSFRA